MDICGEHNDDIAHAERSCPACVEIEELKDEHQDKVKEMQEEIDRLDNLLAEKIEEESQSQLQEL